MITFPGRIPVVIHPIFWLLVIAISWMSSQSLEQMGVWLIVIPVSILFHEYGHALTAYYFNQKVEINLVALGGLTKYDGRALSAGQQFLITLNGPLAGFLLFVLSYKLQSFANPSQILVNYILHVSMFINLYWTLLNLLPVFPLDGGQLTRIFFTAFFKYRGEKIAALLSFIVGGVLGFYFIVHQQLFIGALLLMMAFENYQMWSKIKVFVPQDESDELNLLLNQAKQAIKNNRLDEALDQLIYIRNQAPKGVLYVNATQLGARILAEKKSYKKAYEWLLPLQKRVDSAYLQLLHQLSFYLQEWEQTVKIGNDSYQLQANYQTALLNALSYAIMGQDKPAVGWLKTAVNDGLPDVDAIIAKREFDAIRSSTAFKNWIASEH